MLKETFSDFIEDNALSRAAAIAFYTVLSIGPVLLICIAIAGLVFGEEAAQGAIFGQLQGLMGDQAAQMVQSMVASAGRQRTGMWATVIGIVTLLLTASGVFGEMQSALNFIWRAEPKASLTTILKARAASLGLVATMGFLMLVSLVISAAVDRTWQLPERDDARHQDDPDRGELCPFVRDRLGDVRRDLQAPAGPGLALEGRDRRRGCDRAAVHDRQDADRDLHRRPARSPARTGRRER